MCYISDVVTLSVCLVPLEFVMYTQHVYQLYIEKCGMSRGRLQRKSSAHIRDVCTLHSIVVALWIIGYILFTCLLIVAQSKVRPCNMPHNN